LQVARRPRLPPESFAYLQGVSDVTTRTTVAALAVFGILCGSGGRGEEPAPIPGGIKLLPGYKHEKLQGIDTRVGKIWKEGGLTIRYDIGRLAGNHVKAHSRENLLWYKEQVVDGRTVQLALTLDRILHVTFPETTANFFGMAKGDEEVADILLMVLTYAPPAKPK
jgi:hypothetical protein